MNSNAKIAIMKTRIITFITMLLAAVSYGQQDAQFTQYMYNTIASAFMVKSRRFWSSSNVPFSTIGFLLS